jgi:IclR family pca regulon transcriptional regulator
MSGTASPIEVRQEPSANSLQRGLSILAWLAAQQGPHGVREIANATGINKSSVHRFLEAMRREGWVAQDPQAGKYDLGPMAFEIGFAALDRMDFRAIARPLLEVISARTGETSYLGVLVGADVGYVDVILGQHAIVVNRDVGTRLPAHRTAVGKVLLADLADEALAALFPNTHVPALPDGTVRTREALQAELAHAREHGLAHNDEESSPGVYSLAAPLRDFRGRVVAGIGLGGPKERVLPHLQAYEELVKAVAAEGSRRLGYRGGSSTHEVVASRRELEAPDGRPRKRYRPNRQSAALVAAAGSSPQSVREEVDHA